MSTVIDGTTGLTSNTCIFGDSSGNVGIGTTSPSYKLDVQGTLGAGSTITTGTGVSTGSVGFELGGARTGDGVSFIDFHSVASTDYEARIIRNAAANGTFQLINSGTGELSIQQAGAAPITFQTTATERMRIDSSGSVGIGVTANASAILDAQSTTKGVRMPNMTTTQKYAISTPAAGLMVFDTTLSKLCVYTGAAWQTITSA